MKGSPFTQLLVVGLLFTVLLQALLAVSLRAPPEPDPMAHLHTDEGHRIKAWAILHFAHAPRHVHLHQGMQNLWHVDPHDALELEQEVEISILDGHAEIHVHAVWPEGTPETVIELTLEPDGLAEQTVSAWGRTKLDSVLSFKWRAP